MASEEETQERERQREAGRRALETVKKIQDEQNKNKNQGTR